MDNDGYEIRRYRLRIDAITVRILSAKSGKIEEDLVRSA